MKPSKQKLTTKDICREYYESQIFRPMGDEKATPAAFFVDASIFLEAADSNFKGVDLDNFFSELVAANVELFGLAWLNHNWENKKTTMPESFFTEEIAFTKRYMQDTGKSDVWENMSFYNNSIAETVTEQAILESWGCLRDIPSAIRVEDSGKAQETFLTQQLKLISEMVNKYLSDSDCRDRLAYRFLAIPCDLSRITLLSQKISILLLKRVKCELNQAGLFTLQRVIVGLWDNAVNYLNAVDEWGSYEAAKNARATCLQGLKRWASEHRET